MVAQAAADFHIPLQVAVVIPAPVEDLHAARAALQQRSHPMVLRRRTVQLRQEYLRLFTEWSRLHAGDEEVL